jgi:protein-S-isoprenylcysteine O-methyltransferase Ste14
MRLWRKAAGLFFLFLAETVFLIFFPAGTSEYPEGWVFLSLFFLPLLFGGLWLFRQNPELLQKRMNLRERSGRQSEIALLIGILFNAGLILAGLDERFGWTKLSLPVKVFCACVMLAGCGICLRTAKVNPFLSRTVEVQTGQRAVDSGPYGIVRHPMYAATVFLFLSMGFVLGSPISFAILLFYLPIIAKRIRNEEAVLTQGLDGYQAYKEKVKYKVIPFIW